MFQAKSLGVISPKLLDFIHEQSSQPGAQEVTNKSSEVSPSHYESDMSHIEGGKQGGVSERREARKMTLPES